MPQISQITLPTGTTYDLKDAYARDAIEAIVGGDAVVFVGVSGVALTDGGTERPVVDEKTLTPVAGQLFFYGTQQFIWGTDSKWHALGSLESLGALAYKNNASASYTPAGTVSTPTFTGTTSNVTITTASNANGNYQPSGTVSKPTFSGTSFNSTGKFTPDGSVTVTTNATTNKTATVSAAVSGATTYTPDGTVSAPTISVDEAGATTTIKNPTSVTVAKAVITAAPGMTAPSNAITYYSVTNENLSLYQLGYTTGASITTNDVTVKTGDASYKSSQPTFDGTGVRLVTDNIPVPNTYTATFTGEEGNISVSGTATGDISQPTFTGNKVQFSGTTTANGTVSQPTFEGTGATITVS